MRTENWVPWSQPCSNAHLHSQPRHCLESTISGGFSETFPSTSPKTSLSGRVSGGSFTFCCLVFPPLPCCDPTGPYKSRSFLFRVFGSQMTFRPIFASIWSLPAIFPWGAGQRGEEDGEWDTREPMPLSSASCLHYRSKWIKWFVCYFHVGLS